MAGGLVALLDDVATIAKAAAASADDVVAAAGRTSAKAAGVVVDDAAVTPQFVDGVSPKRELPIIWKITKGSLVNKLVIILPIALLLSQFAPWIITPILMLGGSYLCFEGMEKVWEKIEHSLHKDDAAHQEQMDKAINREPKDEKSLVKSAIFTDLILSTEIMVISLNEVADEPLLQRAMVLIVVALAITLVVYGVVGLLIKMDDIGLHLSKKDGAIAAFGNALVKAMPIVLNIIGIVGTFAMLWVGGHIMLVGLEETGWWRWPEEIVHHLEEMVPGGFIGWLVNTGCSLVFGAIWGAIIVAVVHLLPFGKKDKEAH